MKDGWTASIIDGFPDVRVFSAPENEGHVTVDYTRRGWRLGISARGITFPAKSYKGRGWRDRLEADAVAYLESVLNRRDDINCSANHSEGNPK